MQDKEFIPYADGEIGIVAFCENGQAYTAIEAEDAIVAGVMARYVMDGLKLPKAMTLHPENAALGWKRKSPDDAVDLCKSIRSYLEENDINEAPLPTGFIQETRSLLKDCIQCYKMSVNLTKKLVPEFIERHDRKMLRALRDALRNLKREFKKAGEDAMIYREIQAASMDLLGTLCDMAEQLGMMYYGQTEGDDDEGDEWKKVS